MDDYSIHNHRISTGIAGLDEVLLGGLPSDHVYLIEGAPGTGKTTLALHFALEGLRRGASVLYVALSETERELKAVASSHDWDISALSIFEVTPVEASINPGEEYTIFHPEEVEMAETIKLILNRVEAAKANLIVIDSLAELRLLSRDPVRYRRQVLALKQVLTQRRLTVLLLDDRTSQTLDHQLHSLVHGVISLERLAREYGKNRRRLEIVKLRGSGYAEGFHDYGIRRSGLIVYPRLVSAGRKARPQRGSISSNLPGLDRLVGGGLDRGSATLIVGPAGSGKTTIALKYATAATERNEPVAIYTFDEGRNNLITRANALGMNISDHLNRGTITIDQVNPAELSPGDFANRVRRCVERESAEIVIIDSLNGYMTGMPQEEFLSLQMHELLNYLNERGVVTILILAQQGVLGSMQTNVDVSYLADSIILLRFFEAMGSVRRAISVVKKRTSAHEQTIREFTIGLPNGIEIGEPLNGFQGVLSGLPTFVGDPEHLSKQV